MQDTTLANAGNQKKSNLFPFSQSLNHKDVDGENWLIYSVLILITL